MAYSELIKNFEKVRAYMREFYVYGFKSRTEYDAKSARSYDDERRRLESWLGDYMHFTQTPEGKNVFLSVDSRVTRKNPFYKAWKAKSFTDGDITLHFAIFDVLYDPETKMTLTELIAEIDQRLSSRMTFDESTLRKKLKEYAEEGIIRMEKTGRKVLYSRAPDTDITALRDVIDFFSEVAPCGVIGSFLQDRQPKHPELFSFKHHYITQAMDSDVMATLFEAIHGHRYITVDNLGKHSNEVRTVRLVPLKLYISAQNGRQNLLAFHEKANRLNSYWSWYGFGSRVEWCACFVSWCANECGYIDTGVIPKFAGCVNGVQWFRERGQWADNAMEPSPGMIVFFDWDNKGNSGLQDGQSDHVGIVQKVENGIVYTIEGNSGDSCRVNQYPVGYYEILGYGVSNP